MHLSVITNMPQNAILNYLFTSYLVLFYYKIITMKINYKQIIIQIIIK
jgi:hypothetical protein